MQRGPWIFRYSYKTLKLLKESTRVYEELLILEKGNVPLVFDGVWSWDNETLGVSFPGEVGSYNFPATLQYNLLKYEICVKDVNIAVRDVCAYLEQVGKASSVDTFM